METNMIIEELSSYLITEDFLDTINSLKPTKLSVAEAKNIFYEWEEICYVPGIYVAIENKKVIGSATLAIEKKFIHNGGIVGKIEDVAVHQDHRKKNVATSLIKHLIEVGKNKGCYKITLDCKPELQELYSKCGFKIIPEINMRFDILENQIRELTKQEQSKIRPMAWMEDDLAVVWEHVGVSDF